MFRQIIPIVVVAAIVAIVSAVARAEFVCDWTSGPEGWYYYLDEPQGLGAPMTWVAVGGQQGGYVQAPLAAMTEWESLPGAYYPAYAYGWVRPGESRELNPVDFTQDGVVSAWFKSDTSVAAIQPFDLKGGRLHLFIGEWNDPDGPGGVDPGWTFYHSTQPLLITITPTWQRASLDVSQPSAWTLWADEGLHKPFHELMDTPQQWGFTILGASGVPTGTLAVDTLRVVPEPTTLALLAALAALRPRRRR